MHLSPGRCDEIADSSECPMQPSVHIFARRKVRIVCLRRLRYVYLIGAVPAPKSKDRSSANPRATYVSAAESRQGMACAENEIRDATGGKVATLLIYLVLALGTWKYSEPYKSNSTVACGCWTR